MSAFWILVTGLWITITIASAGIGFGITGRDRLCWRVLAVSVFVWAITITLTILALVTS